MASPLPVFDLTIAGTRTMNQESWIDLGLIPSGKTVFIGYATFIAQDKNGQFELRSNLSTKSAGTAADTQLHDWSSAQGGSGIDRDLYQSGYINTLTVTSTGVEHWWLHITTQSNNTGVFDYIIHYTLL